MDSIPAANFQETASRALQAYDLQPTALTFLQHSENITFRVETSQGSYLLRLHVPVTPTFGDHGAKKAVVNSEMLWLQALKKARFPVPPPVETREGGFVTQVDGINATLLKWQPGELMTREKETEDTAAQLGTLVGKLHQHTMHWTLPKGFSRPRRDAAYFENAMLALWPAVEDGRIASQDYRALQTALSALTSEIRSLSQTRATSGLLHGDLHRGNFLLQRGKIKLIDFSMSAFGHYAYDLGTCLSNVRSIHHPVFLERYTQFMPLPRGYERLVEAYFLGSSIATFALWINDAGSQETLIRRVPVIAEEFAARFNNDERFWFTRNG